MPTPESKTKAKIRKLLDSYGKRIYYHMPVPNGYGRPTVDYLCCVDGLFVALEAKAPDGRVTAMQHATLADVRDAGGSSFVVRDDEDLCAVKIFIDRVLAQAERKERKPETTLDEC